MDSNQAIPPSGKVFTFTEELEEGTLQAHSYGNGRFIQGITSEDCEVSFSLYKADEKSLSIQIYDGNLFQWLRTIPNLRDDLDKDSLSISMNALLPHYPDVRERFAQYKREGHSFDALELFVHHFLREGSVFATFGFEHLHEEDILTELHFHDIQSQSRSISEDLDLLDEAIDKLQAEKIMELGPTLEVMESVPALSETQSQLQASIKRRDPIAVGKVLATYPTYIDTGSLFVAMFYYEPTVFRLLLKHGAEVDGAVFGEMPLCLAAEMGNMDAVRLLLHYGADREGLCLLGHKRPLSGAASAGHLEIVRYLVEEKGANVDGKNGISPLSGALKHNHTHIAGYLLSAGADVPNLEDIDPPDIAEILRECGLDSDLTLHRTLLGKLLRLAASFGDINAVERLINAGADVNPTTHDQPLCIAALHGHLEVVRLLVMAGSWVNPSRGSLPLCRAASFGHLEVVRLLVRAGAIVNPQDLGQFDRSPLAEAAMGEQAKVAHFLSTTGATLRQGEYRLRAKSKTFKTVGDFLKHLKDSGWFEDQEDCPAVAAIRAQERRIAERRLFVNVASSCERLLDAGATQYASDGLREFVAQVGTSSSVFKSGTRAIRYISEGYKPCGLRAIVSTLQVADAMRSVIPASELFYSKKEFLDDIPRWASLLGTGDQQIFDEIAHHLWGVPGSISAQEGATSFAWDETLMFLQELVNNIVRMSVLFDHGSGSSCDPCRLQSLRQKHLSARRHESETRLPLTEWCPSPPPQVQRSVHSDEPKPPDQNGEIGALARITVLMAGAIFGVILLYLCVSQYGSSIPSLLLLASKTGQGWASSHIVARNCVILAMYIRFTSVVDSVSWNSDDNALPNPTQMPLVLPDTPTTETTERVREHIATSQSSCGGDCTMIDSPRRLAQSVVTSDDVPISHYNLGFHREYNDTWLDGPEHFEGLDDSLRPLQVEISAWKEWP